MKPNPYQLFIKNLFSLSSWERANFRLCAYGDPSRNLGALQVFLSILPRDIRQEDERTLFVIACLYCQTRHRAESGNLGASLFYLSKRDPERRNGLERRLKTIIEAQSDEILRQNLFSLVEYLDSQGIGVNYQRLMEDLLRWNDPGKKVQQAWYRSFILGEPDRPSAAKADGA